MDFSKTVFPALMGVKFSEGLVEIVYVTSADNVREKINAWFDDIEPAHFENFLSEAFESDALWFECEGIQDLSGLIISIDVEIRDLEKNLLNIAGLYSNTPLFPVPP